MNTGKHREPRSRYDQSRNLPHRGAHHFNETCQQFPHHSSLIILQPTPSPTARFCEELFPDGNQKDQHST